jgi:hypothetical protein
MVFLVFTILLSEEFIGKNADKSREVKQQTHPDPPLSRRAKGIEYKKIFFHIVPLTRGNEGVC